MPLPDTDHPLAASQAGYFTTTQAADTGYSRPLLDHNVGTGRFMRVLRGIYRLRDFLSSDYKDLVVAWLWSDQQGVVSYDATAGQNVIHLVACAQDHPRLRAQVSSGRSAAARGTTSCRPACRSEINSFQPDPS